MATLTLGTNATDSLTSVVYSMSDVTLLPADLATIAQGILDDLNPSHPIVPGSFTYAGRLWIPNRGNLIMNPGDVVAIDSTGWPILVSANAIANGPWTLS
jgi:hypothetical protein